MTFITLKRPAKHKSYKVTQLLDEGSIFQYCPAGMDGGREAVVAKQTQPTWSIALPRRWRNTFKNDLFNSEHLKNHDIFVSPQVLRNVLLYRCSNHAASGNSLFYVFVNEADDTTIEGRVVRVVWLLNVAHISHDRQIDKWGVPLKCHLDVRREPQ